MSLIAIQTKIKNLSNNKKAQQAMKYFKTGPGQHGFGDKFIGLSNPQMRLIAKQQKNITIDQVQTLLNSQIHQMRFIGLIILTQKYKQKKYRINIFQFYLKNLKAVNNWDLVDLSAPNIIGAFLLQNTQKKDILYQLSKSQIIWERRISIISTFSFIRANQFDDTLKISKILLKDKHDLIHKGVGWMLRQVWKRSPELTQKFLKDHYQQIPRTALRYAIQKFQEDKRQQYLKGLF